MKRTLMPLLAAALLLPACARQEAPAAGDHDAVASLEQAQALSRETGEPILVDFWRDG